MNITEEQRDVAYENASQVQKHKYGSSAAGKTLRTIADKHHITGAETYKNYAITVGDVILGLRQRTELPTLIAEATGKPQETAIAITGDLIEFLNRPLPAPTDSAEDLAAEIAEAEQVMAGMGGATPQSPTYSSSQEVLLREAKGQNPSTQ